MSIIKPFSLPDSASKELNEKWAVLMSDRKIIPIRQMMGLDRRIRDLVRVTNPDVRGCWEGYLHPGSCVLDLMLHELVGMAKEVKGRTSVGAPVTPISFSVEAEAWQFRIFVWAYITPD